MAKQSSIRLDYGLLLKLYHHPRQVKAKSKTSSTFSSDLISRTYFASSSSQFTSPFLSSSLPSSISSSYFLSGLAELRRNSRIGSCGISSSNLGFRKSLGVRNVSKTPDFGKVNATFAKTLVSKPVSVVRSAYLRYREAVGLQIDAFWKNNYLVLLGAGGIVCCALLWKVMFGVASTFVSLSEGMAKYGFLALSAAIVAFSGIYIRSRFTINPDKVYRIAMRKLNTSASILEVMGAPLSGTDLRAYVMSGGGLTLKKFKPTFRSRRCFLIFPIRGSERKGLVSVGVKKKKGQYDMMLLAVDIPMITGPDQRMYLIGNDEEYKVGGGLISELRDPVVRAMAATKEFEDLDEMEREADDEREVHEAERRRRGEIEKLKGS